MTAEVRREKARLELRHVQADHRAMDEAEAERKRKAREQREAARQDELDRKAAVRRDAEEVHREKEREGWRQKRNENIQLAVGSVGTKLRLLRLTSEEIERATDAVVQGLERIPVGPDALRPMDFINMAGTALSIALPFFEQAKLRQAQEREQTRQREALAEKRLARKVVLVRQGVEYAAGEITEGDSWARFVTGQQVKEKLEARLTGAEDRGELEDVVDEILEGHGAASGR